jgi:hypothetical protein
MVVSELIAPITENTEIQSSCLEHMFYMYTMKKLLESTECISNEKVLSNFNNDSTKHAHRQETVLFSILAISAKENQFIKLMFKYCNYRNVMK